MSLGGSGVSIGGVRSLRAYMDVMGTNRYRNI